MHLLQLEAFMLFSYIFYDRLKHADIYIYIYIYIYKPFSVFSFPLLLSVGAHKETWNNTKFNQFTRSGLHYLTVTFTSSLFVYDAFLLFVCLSFSFYLVCFHGGCPKPTGTP
ncbi:hypothetical protein, unlikely [Trypanosoma brucei gambiense DAL972]|uniref:Uncharacterized protein n=1 Tax=Trypanosoma brucei gambiense (strain MHOM/CI/86/DAL972) TaxID=679716 RepID=D0A767_TRYB9|nr:hypothetical protein, unlikely [Trypanosoma brucei gambiense DAL972]CBH17518.1 hypothetical protein, unlikely [Trypanosoma brucei gambiense DAL972]|eukprot:XP_011779782.1 hypothetical protein, unlikely [Trypanosoma brucei gambiense DAL972]